ncbi:MAG TPA: DUF3043 domain-containing protein [Microbacteriaceae bacterium]|nr:DUF3043 domain-containing protein [Microbacteriaceae bacterium]
MSEEIPNSGKGRPTPSRKEAQAANARPLVPNKRDKDAVRAQKLAQREVREKARLGAMMGDEKYLTARDKGPQRKFARDYVDSRFNIGEWTIPIMFLVLLMTLINNPTFQLVSLATIWVFVGVAIIDSIFTGIRVQKSLASKYGSENVQSGTKWYVGMRAMQMRALRVPKPQVKRGQRPKV